MKLLELSVPSLVFQLNVEGGSNFVQPDPNHDWINHNSLQELFISQEVSDYLTTLELVSGSWLFPEQSHGSGS